MENKISVSENGGGASYIFFNSSTNVITQITRLQYLKFVAMISRVNIN